MTITISRRTWVTAAVAAGALLVGAVATGAVLLLPTLQRVDASLDGLAAVADAIDVLGGGFAAMRADLADMQSTLAAMLDVLEQLGGDFGAMVALLEKTAEHVENLDRKTGPPPPDWLVPWVE